MEKVDESNKNGLEASLDQTLELAPLQDVTVSMVDAILQSGVSSDVFKEIPIVGTLVNLVRAGNNISNLLFTKKVLKFLVELNEIPLEQRQKEYRKIK